MLNGDQGALTAEEKLGFQTFVDSGCAMCHNGALLGGTSYQRIGAAKPFPRAADPGRMAVTHAESDKATFKVPSLRNIEKTGPYLHDGSMASLDDVVKLMAKHQLNKELKGPEVASIVTFLRALTGDLPAKAIAEPKLPASGKDTPKPDPS